MNKMYRVEAAVPPTAPSTKVWLVAPLLQASMGPVPDSETNLTIPLFSGVLVVLAVALLILPLAFRTR